MVSTVKIHENTKDSLSKFRKSTESYDGAIRRLLSAVENKERASSLKKGYQAMSESQFEEFLEWDKIE
jgi:hypothetical protein